MIATRHLLRALAAMAALAAAGAMAQDQQHPRAGCAQSSCFGIDWRQPLTSQVTELPVGLATPSGATPLHYAVRHCAAPIILLALAEAGEDFNRIDPATDLPPIGNAILVCNTAAVRTLLELGASPLATEPAGGNMLHYALRKDRSHFLELMLEHIVDLDQRDEAGLTPLQLALWLEDRSAAMQLLAAGADPDVRGQGGLGLAHLAVYRGDKELLRELLAQGADFNAPDEAGRVPLHYAVTRGFDHETATIFRAAEAHTGIFDNSGKAPIHYAASLADSASIAALLALRADPDQPDASGESPLVYALRSNPDVRVVTALLRMGADPNQPSVDGDPPLQLAASLRDDSAFGELIAAGADLQQTDDQGRTLLHLAVLGGNSSLAARLLDMGLDPDAPDATGVTPLQLAELYQLGGPGGDRLAGILAERKAVVQQQLEKDRAAALEAAERKRERIAELREQRAAAAAKRREALERPPDPRVLKHEISRDGLRLEREKVRLRNLPADSPDAKRLAAEIEGAEAALAAKREQLAGQQGN